LPDSQLYINAVNALGRADRAIWDEVHDKIAAVIGPNVRNQSGSDVADNIRNENHLTDDPQDATPGLMRVALEALCGASWPDEPHEFAEEYDNTLAAARLQGRSIQAEDKVLYRYMAQYTFAYIAEALRDAGRIRDADELADWIDRAEDKEAGTSWHDVMTFVKHPTIWADPATRSVLLTGAHSMFVTFDPNSPPPTTPAKRNDAAWMHAALALWRPPFECMLEARYEARDDDKLKHPTFADAGWFRFFRPAGADEPHGWTRPHRDHEDDLPPQPEAVQEPQTLARLQNPDDFRIVTT